MDRYLSEIRLEMRVLKILNIHLIFVSHRAFKTILETAREEAPIVERRMFVILDVVIWIPK